MVKDFIDHIHFDEVVSSSQCTDLSSTTLHRSTADLRGISAGDPSAFLSALQILFVGETSIC